MTNRGTLDIRNVSKGYSVDGRRLDVLSNVNLHVAPGEFISIVGPSGCGKSTLLRLIIGLDTDYGGDILLDGARITGTSLDRGIVFQDHRLLPWLTLEKNIALALENSGLSAREKRETVAAHIRLVGLEGFETAYPHQLSGGMAQRGAIARGLVGRPGILLLDEPLGALDALTRLRLQEEIVRIWRAEGVTMILVTHDVDEAIYLSDRVIVMNSGPGRIVEEITVNQPRPRDRAGADFAGIKRRVLALMGEYEIEVA
ncbi:ABC transporter ATP-binding protein [Paenirhodobacter populi]|uniref:ABC transporter ATP-binding protein n=1 Tax=Paenirhodobacter populi TaxID=2306993 RepID=UPI000FE375A3|nr:ABC transporter ATP-binding protein [Sinirhodobacter populi]RWR04591.1 ABC transporter ATP-binding protein [Sinirhodobacter populi]